MSNNQLPAGNGTNRIGQLWDKYCEVIAGRHLLPPFKFKQAIEELMQEAPQPGAVWVKASDCNMSKGGMLFYRFNGPTLKSIGIGHFVGDVFHGTHLDVFPKPDWKYLYVLDESEQPAAAREEDAVEFAEWVQENAVAQYENKQLHSWRIFGPYTDNIDYTTAQLYELFKQQKEK